MASPEEIARFEGRRRGINAELITEKALEDLRSGGKIHKFIRHNACGIDYILLLPGGKEFLLQVKNGSRYAVEHIFKHPEIPVVVVHCTTNMSKKEERKRQLRTRAKILEIIEHVNN
jgi:hypothetical protein